MKNAEFGKEKKRTFDSNCTIEYGLRAYVVCKRDVTYYVNTIADKGLFPSLANLSVHKTRISNIIGEDHASLRTFLSHSWSIRSHYHGRYTH